MYDDTEGYENNISANDLQMEVEENGTETHHNNEEIVVTKAEKIPAGSASDVRRKIEDIMERRRYSSLLGEEFDLEDQVLVCEEA